jgi:hypothetical protein
MPYELVKNGDILRHGGVSNHLLNLHYFATPVAISPSDPDYELVIHWLSDEEAERARAILSDYRAHQAQAS